MKKLLTVILVMMVQAVVAQTSDTTLVLADSAVDFSTMSLEELSKLKTRYKASPMEQAVNQAIEVASRKPLPLRKSPSVISVISAEEIERSGARDLMDVLAMVPGVEFNVDVEGVVSISLRGLWATEGNISLQIDGVEMNELGYATLQFGNHYPISQIKKVQIIRGPGSAIYGGCAQYAVINIVTYKGEDIKGVRATVLGGQAAGTYARQHGGLSIGNKIGDFNYVVSGSYIAGKQSNKRYTDVYGSGYEMKDNAEQKNTFINVQAGYKGLSVQMFYDGYNTTNRDGDLRTLSKAYPLDFSTCVTNVKYEGKLAQNMRVQAQLMHKYSEPWKFEGASAPVDSDYYTYRLVANSYRANMGVLWDPLYWLNVNVGMGGSNDVGYRTDGTLFRKDSSDRVSYYNYAPYAQLTIKTAAANVVAGARWDNNNAFGGAFNPRLGITKRVGIYNFKLLYASSFRAPSIENVQFAVGKRMLKPERSNTLELEVSAQLMKDMYLSLNMFDINTRDAIIYSVKTNPMTVGVPDGYRNSSSLTGSTGLEAEWKYKGKKLGFTATYAYYTMANKGIDITRRVAQDATVALGTTKHKLNLAANVNVSEHWYLSPSINYLGKRYAISHVGINGMPVITTLKDQLITNLYLGTDKLVKGMTAGVGVNNILDELILYPQPYNSCHAPLPGMGRELFIRCTYHIMYKQAGI